jgi:hypothetical protein
MEQLNTGSGNDEQDQQERKCDECNAELMIVGSSAHSRYRTSSESEKTAIIRILMPSVCELQHITLLIT